MNNQTTFLQDMQKIYNILDNFNLHGKLEARKDLERYFETKEFYNE